MENAENTNDKLDLIIDMLKILTKKRLSNPKQILYDHVMARGVINTKEAMQLLKINREPTLKHMKGLGDELGFTFKLGEPNRGKASQIIYDYERVIADQNSKILAVIKVKEFCALHDVMVAFDNYDVENVKECALRFCDCYPDYILENNIIFEQKKRDVILMKRTKQIREA